MKRELTNEENLYRRLMFALNHYDGDLQKAVSKNVELLSEVRASSLPDDFKTYFERVWFDQVSKHYDIAKNNQEAVKSKFDSLGLSIDY
jgi:hypothetical protein